MRSTSLLLFLLLSILSGSGSRAQAAEPGAQSPGKGGHALSTGSRTDDKPYLKARRAGVTITPLLTVGETVPRTSAPSGVYRMVGAPDGLGAHAAGDSALILYMNHELHANAETEPVGADSARNGALISRFVLSRPGAGIRSGDFAFTSVKSGDGTADTAGILDHLCSGNMAGPEVGLSEFIYFAGEETHKGGFGGKGGEALAVAGGTARLLADFGRMSFENVVVVPSNDPAATVAFAMEDGPLDNCQLYMYVGRKSPSAKGLLARNGLAGGRLFVFKPTDPALSHEGTFASGILAGAWAEIKEVSGKTSDRLDADARAAGAFTFDRIEDGTYDRNRKGVFYFATTGGSSRNPQGRIYRLSFDPANPAGGAASLEILVTGAPGSIMAPDNMDANAAGQILIQEDPTDSCFAHLRVEKRNPSIWLYGIDSRSLSRLAELDETAVPAPLRNTADTWWESSGVMDASAWYGKGAWLLNVQAHSVQDPKAAALQGQDASVKVHEGGQLILVKVK